MNSLHSIAIQVGTHDLHYVRMYDFNRQRLHGRLGITDYSLHRPVTAKARLTSNRGPLQYFQNASEALRLQQNNGEQFFLALSTAPANSACHVGP